MIWTYLTKIVFFKMYTQQLKDTIQENNMVNGILACMKSIWIGPEVLAPPKTYRYYIRVKITCTMWHYMPSLCTINKPAISSNPPMTRYFQMGKRRISGVIRLVNNIKYHTIGL